MILALFVLVYPLAGSVISDVLWSFYEEVEGAELKCTPSILGKKLHLYSQENIHLDRTDTR